MFKLLLICCSLTCVKILSENLKCSTEVFTQCSCVVISISHYYDILSILRPTCGPTTLRDSHASWLHCLLGDRQRWGPRHPWWCRRWRIPARCNWAHLYAQLEFCKQTPRKGLDLLFFLSRLGWEALRMGILKSHLLNAAMLKFSLENEKVASVQL